VSKSRRCAKFGGVDLHAAVTVSPDDRYALERRCRYLCRPAISHERLELLDGAQVGLELKTPFSDGTSPLELTFDELQRLCALVPRPGTHRVHYHGILAPASVRGHLLDAGTDVGADQIGFSRATRHRAVSKRDC